MDISSLERFFKNQCSGSERQRVVGWLSDPENDAAIRRWMRENWDSICASDIPAGSDDPDIEKIWKSVQKRLEKQAPPPDPLTDVPPHNFLRFNTGPRIKRFAAAAAIVAAMACGTWYVLWSRHEAATFAPTGNHARFEHDIAPPAGNKAVLTLSDGSKVYLDSAGNGILATQGEVKIAKKHNGEIEYVGNEAAAARTPAYNTLSLPKGSKPIHLVLSDGSVVWLNAASSVTYPTAFTGSKRKVAITGEAYFEVTGRSAMPFYVSHGDVVVKVLGTRFNVNTYDDDKDVKVTLLEGVVDVSSGSGNERLKPGQQARLSGSNIQVIQLVDLEEVMAWKNDQFYFTGTDIKTIMHEVERYYNVEVQYKDSISYKFVAKISRDVSMSQFLEKLELTNLVHFKMEGNKIIVTK